MVVRKNPSVDLERYRVLHLGIGYVLSLLIVIIAFEWKFYDDSSLVNLSNDFNGLFEETFDIPITEQPPPPPPSKSSYVELIEVPDIEEIEEDIQINLDIEITEEMVVEEMEIEFTEIEEEIADEIFAIVEQNPKPIGGYEAFYAYIFKNIKYPRIALASSVEGKVFVQFVVNKNGELTDFEVVKGVGFGCDEEAVRVLQSAPNWIPGKQRGKPVKVRIVIPIKFILGG